MDTTGRIIKEIRDNLESNEILFLRGIFQDAEGDYLHVFSSWIPCSILEDSLQVQSSFNQDRVNTDLFLLPVLGESEFMIEDTGRMDDGEHKIRMEDWK